MRNVFEDFAFHIQIDKLVKSGLLYIVTELAMTGFASVTILAHGPVAQSVEQRTENPCVGGSIPPQATI